MGHIASHNGLLNQNWPKFKAQGDQVLLVEYPDEISIHIHEKVHRLMKRVEAARIPAVKCLIPTFHTLAMMYDPRKISYASLAGAVQALAQCEDSPTEEGYPEVEVPVIYGGKYGPDLSRVAEATGLTEEEVIRRHTSRAYRVFMIGFTAGFPYVGELDERLVLPRKATPSLSVPAGSVAIADRLTGIYTLPSPGGWHVIGWTPLQIFDAYRSPPGMFQVGFQLRFKAAGEEELLS